MEAKRSPILFGVRTHISGYVQLVFLSFFASERSVQGFRIYLPEGFVSAPTLEGLVGTVFEGGPTGRNGGQGW